VSMGKTAKRSRRYGGRSWCNRTVDLYTTTSNAAIAAHGTSRPVTVEKNVVRHFSGRRGTFAQYLSLAATDFFAAAFPADWSQNTCHTLCLKFNVGHVTRS
jgi:hypothetical protein